MSDPAPAADAAHRPRVAWATGAGLCAVLLLAAWPRFAWSAMPFSDADTWGYLHPALAKLNGGAFEHTFGRNFLYPGWIYLLLRATGDFRAIPLAQHALGLATGALLWVAWRQWRAWFTQTRLPGWADAALGLGGVALYTQSVSAIHFEHAIRPEAIFPFFAAAEFCLQLFFLRRWFVEGRATSAAVLAGLAIFDAALLYQLKPSSALALPVALAPVLAALWKPPAATAAAAGRARRQLAVASGAAGLAALACFAWPEHELARGDDMATLFLPETLLTVHADIIRDQMSRDLAARVAPLAPPGGLPLAAVRDELAQAVDYARTSALHGLYPSLGFDPDAIMYGGQSFCYRLTRPPVTPASFASFARGYYFRAWTRQPARMTGKVCRQLGVFYSLHCPAFWPVREVRLDRPYRLSVRVLSFASFQEPLAYPPARAYLDAARRLGASDRTRAQPLALVAANTAASVGYLPLLALFLAAWTVSALAWAGKFPTAARLRQTARLFVPGLVLVALFQGFTFGNCLTIAIVHSLNVDRYSHNLLVFCAPFVFAEIAWLCEFALACLFVETSGRRPQPASPEQKI